MIAFIADIHGNYSALKAVLAHIDAIGITKIVSLGDVAGYYCQINECIDELRKRGIVNLMGNHDFYLGSGAQCGRSKVANMCLKHQESVIRQDNLEWLRGCVPYLVMNDGITCVHGGWLDPIDEYIFKPTESYFLRLPHRYYFSGHTHVQVLAEFGNRTYCNPGAIGQPRDGDPRAAFATFDDGRIELHRVVYDIDEVSAAMQDAGFDPPFYENLRLGSRIGGRVDVATIVRDDSGEPGG